MKSENYLPIVDVENGFLCIENNINGRGCFEINEVSCEFSLSISNDWRDILIQFSDFRRSGAYGNVGV